MFKNKVLLLIIGLVSTSIGLWGSQVLALAVTRNIHVGGCAKIGSTQQEPTQPFRSDSYRLGNDSVIVNPGAQ